ncbi:hypothetical protein COU61_03770, partial [Candidatus Pacearchaeota archaeon CG10_big_fil_rev_8_21_14_0_10_35_13]
MKQKIMKKIHEIEKEYKVTIVWAIESGSRAWGFESKDSDYDIRCMHVGRVDDYLGLKCVKQQINYSDGIIDLESWDVQKFVGLMIKSNPQIAEWLRSPIVYRESDIKEKLKEIFDKGASLEYLRQHYLRMAKQNYEKYINGKEKSTSKKYLYVLRGIACAKFIKKENKLPPLPYKEVIGYLPKRITKFFEECIRKKHLTEQKEIKNDYEVTRFIEDNINEKFSKENLKFKEEKKIKNYLIRVIKNSD